MYGLYPSDEMDKDNMKLYPAMSIYSHVVYVKNIEKGQRNKLWSDIIWQIMT